MYIVEKKDVRLIYCNSNSKTMYVQVGMSQNKVNNKNVLTINYCNVFISPFDFYDYRHKPSMRP